MNYLYNQLIIFYIIQKLLNMSQYGKAQYWEERYTRDPQPFDWYQRFNGIKELITSNISPEHRILNVGSGNSRLSEQMFDQGYQNITNIDISQTCTKTMAEKYKDKGPNFKYLQMDVRAMDFPQNSFDTVVDKGTLDSVLCGQGSSTNANKMISQIYRVLSPHGIYFIVSYGQSQYRLPYLQKPQYDWSVKVSQVAKPTIASSITIASDDKDSPNVHFVYVCKKGAKNDS